ncbi:MAG: hypothetical protein RL693_493 [Verrucomicrobiota bacterium]|jgi:hypothetical protein
MRHFSIYVCEEDSVRLEPLAPDDRPRPLGENWDEGQVIDVPEKVVFKTYLKQNKLYDWIGGYSWNPYVSEAVKNRLHPLLGETVQWIGPVECKGRNYFMLNCINIIDCLLPGSHSHKLLFNDNQFNDQWLFRPKGLVRCLIATEQFKKNIFQAGDSGIRFGLVKDDGWVTSFHSSESA